jgi:phosphopantothenoylcysteine decarboxylase/phosphopantothenate--cysteine ligase
MERNDLIAHAKEKLLRKNADMIVANSLRTKGAGFATDTNVATLITKENTEDLPMMSKEDLGLVILDRLMSLKED